VENANTRLNDRIAIVSGDLHTKSFQDLTEEDHAMH